VPVIIIFPHKCLKPLALSLYGTYIGRYLLNLIWFQESWGAHDGSWTGPADQCSNSAVSEDDGKVSLASGWQGCLFFVIWICSHFLRFSKLNLFTNLNWRNFGVSLFTREKLFKKKVNSEPISSLDFFSAFSVKRRLSASFHNLSFTAFYAPYLHIPQDHYEKFICIFC